MALYPELTSLLFFIVQCRTNSSVIEGMYRVVHKGFDRSATIDTAAFAGCVRVVRCSSSQFGVYSEPLLLLPLDAAKISPALSLPAPPRECSLPLADSLERLEELLRVVYPDSQTFQEQFDVSSDPHEVAAHLESMRLQVRAANYELALLLLAVMRLRAQLGRIRVGSCWYTEELECVLDLEPFIPEMDSSPLEFASLIRASHVLIRVRSLNRYFVNNVGTHIGLSTTLGRVRTGVEALESRLAAVVSDSTR